jgi:peptide/nickel transport system substrate-binding protein
MAGILVLGSWAVTGSRAATNSHPGQVNRATASCPAKSGGTVAIATANPFPSLDFTKIVFSTVGWDNVEGLVFGRLVEPTPNLKGIVYKLATAVTPNSTLTQWTIKLRPGVKFSNGARFTAKDVIFSLKYQLAGPVGYVLGPVRKFTAINPLTVRVDMKAPFADFERMGLGSLISYIIPANFAQKSKSEFFQHPIGTGPYKVQSFNAQSGVTLVRNPLYWEKGQPYIDKLVFRVVTDPNTRLLGLKSGQYQAIDNVPPDQAKSVGGDNTTNTIVPSGNVDVMYTSSKGNAVMRNLKLRQAMAAAIDAESIDKAAYAGLATPSHSFIPEVLPNVVPANPPPSFNLAKAKKLVAASGVKLTQPLTLVYPTGTASMVAEAAVLQNTYGQIGIPIKVVPLGFSQYGDRLGRGAFDIAISQYVEIAPTAGNAIGTYPAFNGYFGYWPVAAVEKIVKVFEATNKPKAQQAITKQYNTYVSSRAYQMPIVNEPAIDGFSKRITGLVIDKFDYWHIAQAWLC